MTRSTRIAVVLSAAVGWFYVQVVGTGGWLTAHNAIYHYSGVQLLEGVPPYVSIFDMKTPLASFLSAGAISLGRLVDLSSLAAARIVFALIAASSTVPVYLASRRLFDSETAGLFAVLYLMTVTPWLWDISAGPRPKVLAGALVAWAGWSTVARRWLIAGLLFGLAGLAWQPAILGVGGSVAGSLLEHEVRWSSLAKVLVGVVTPFLAAGAYFVGVEALPLFLDGALRVHLDYVAGRAVLNPLAGLAVLVVLLQDTRIWLGMAAGLGIFNGALLLERTEKTAVPSPVRVALVAGCGLYLLWSLVDIQSPADMYVILPFAAVGIGGAVTILIGHVEESWDLSLRVVVPLVATLFMVSAAASGLRVNTGLQTERERTTSLASQRETVRDILDLTGGNPATVIGATEVLSLAGWTNPTRHVVINSGLDRYIDDHHRGGFRSWMTEVLCGKRRHLVLGRTVGGLMEDFRSKVADQYRLSRRFTDWQLFYPDWVQSFALRRYDLEVWVRETSTAQCRDELAAGSGGRGRTDRTQPDPEEGPRAP